MRAIESIVETIARANIEQLDELNIPIDWSPRPATRDEAMRRVVNLMPVFEKRGWKYRGMFAEQVRQEDQQWWKVWSQWVKKDGT